MSLLLSFFLSSWGLISFHSTSACGPVFHYTVLFVSTKDGVVTDLQFFFFFYFHSFGFLNQRR